MKKILGSLVFILFGLFVLTKQAYATFNSITYYTINDGTYFIRSVHPFNSGSETQSISPKGSVTVNIDNTTGYADSGFVIYDGKLGDINSFTLNGSGEEYGLNIWFDTSGNNEFFAWDSNVLTGLAGDTYGLGPSSLGGVLNVDSLSQFWMMTSPFGAVTLAELQGGLFSGINSNTHIAIWVGVSGTGPKSATVSVPTGNSTPGLDRYLDNPGRQQATDVGAQCGSGAGSGAFGYFGKDNNMAGGADGNQTGLNNSAVCGNRQGNLP